MKNKKRIARLENEVAELKTTIQFLEYRLALSLSSGGKINPVIATSGSRGELPPDMV